MNAQITVHKVVY